VTTLDKGLCDAPAAYTKVKDLRGAACREQEVRRILLEDQKNRELLISYPPVQRQRLSLT
jgi:hypothetical protein